MELSRVISSEDYNTGYNLLHGIGVEKNEQEAFKYFQKAANDGHDKGIFQVGYCYQYGYGIEKNLSKALEYYKKAANMGLDEGMYMVGYCYRHGIGVVKDESNAFRYFQIALINDIKGDFRLGRCFKKVTKKILIDEYNESDIMLAIGSSYHEKENFVHAFKYFQKSADMGNAIGAHNVGRCYLNGIGVEKDEHKAFIYYQKSAEMGFVGGTYMVGHCHHEGIGVVKDEHKAFEYLRKSADMGDADGANNVGNFYRNGIGVENDLRKAFEYYQKSAEKGNVSGTYNVGYCYENGIGVEIDEHKAFKYYKKSAEIGSVAGTFNVGKSYLQGIGVKKDEHRAFEYFQKSAGMGHSMGTYMVGSCYQNGIGVKRDEHKAVLYFQKSAENGNLQAIGEIGYCFRNGIGTPVNIEKANYWSRIEKNKFHEINIPKYEDLDIDSDIKTLLYEDKYQLAWIPYDNFKDIREIGKGGFATVYRAWWYRPNLIFDSYRISAYSVALKKIRDSDLNEIKYYCEIGIENPSFMKCFGISKDENGNYILVLKYAEMGSLRQNISNIAKMNWKDKLSLLLSIVSDLNAIHSRNIVHRDLHSGNILQDSLQSAYIADLGLSIQYTKQEKGKVYGILPFIAPEILEGKDYTTSSDIYSFSMIMWEVLYGTEVTNYNELDDKTQVQEIVINNLRPLTNDEAPQHYVNLMKNCWNKDPKDRPSAEKLYEVFKKWRDDEQILNVLENSNPTLKHIETSYKTYNNNNNSYSRLIDLNSFDFAIDFPELN